MPHRILLLYGVCVAIARKAGMFVSGMKNRVETVDLKIRTING
jgi:hypothetical protein